MNLEELGILLEELSTLSYVASTNKHRLVSTTERQKIYSKAMDAVSELLTIKESAAKRHKAQVDQDFEEVLALARSIIAWSKIYGGSMTIKEALDQAKLEEDYNEQNDP